MAVLLLSALGLSAASGLKPATHGQATVIPTYNLSDGHTIPALGLGVYRVAPGKQTYNTVASALKMGYRMIDTATVYGNEEDVGQAIKDSGIPRSEIFVTSKLWDSDHGYQEALVAGTKSLERIGLDYLDLYLIHSPGQYTKGGGKIVETWDALLKLQKDGKFRSVGVSNFGVAHLQALKEHGRPLPAVNQFEVHPLIAAERAPLVKYCKENTILVQAYGSVLSGHEDLMARMSKVAAQHKKTTAQVLLRWALEQGYQVIPKSTHAERQAENMNVFDFSLTNEQVSEMNNAEGHVSDYWDPTHMPVDIGSLVHWPLR